MARLREAGALVLGATNLDQFATGLVGTRSPYGAVRDARRPDRISGGSSSGSAVAVALGLVDIAIGTDTAGFGSGSGRTAGNRGHQADSGRRLHRRGGPGVPVLGHRHHPGPRPGHCRTGDGDHGRAGPQVACRPPAGRPVPASRCLPVPPSRRSLRPGLRSSARRSNGCAPPALDVEPIELDVFLQAARLLYDGALVAERHAAVGSFIDAALAGDEPGRNTAAGLDPTVIGIITAAGHVPAHQYVADTAALDELRARSDVRGWRDSMPSSCPPRRSTRRWPKSRRTRWASIPAWARTRTSATCSICAPSRFRPAPSRSLTRGGVAQFGLTVVGRTFDDGVVADIARRIECTPASRRCSRPVQPQAAPP